MSEVLTEVVRMDPTFDKEEFIRLCRFDIIPNLLEVVVYTEFDSLARHYKTVLLLYELCDSWYCSGCHSDLSVECVCCYVEDGA